MDASQLLVRPAEVTRSTVQKAVVVIADSPQYFGLLRESLGVVTQAWFAQREFGDTEILRRFQESLAEERERGALNKDEDRDQYLGMSLRELVREFRWQTLVLLKCCLLQPKVSWQPAPTCHAPLLPLPQRRPTALKVLCEKNGSTYQIYRCFSSARGASGYA